MVWFACAALVLVAGCYVLVPLFREPKNTPEADLPDETDLDRLLDRKAVVYRGLRDLDFEHAMGRLSDADYQRLQADYKNDAALLLQQLDALGDSEDLDKALEKDIAARKTALATPGMERKTYRCPSCGAETVPGKKYCADCGKRL
jgi:cytochrome c-type biogenesis protein CcmI